MSKEQYFSVSRHLSHPAGADTLPPSSRHPSDAGKILAAIVGLLSLITLHDILSVLKYTFLICRSIRSSVTNLLHDILSVLKYFFICFIYHSICSYAIHYIT